ncbi:MAG TPA: hypothetical protein VGK73_17640 [Polyangiaceae bacterium]
MELGLVQDDPAPGTAGSPVERAVENAPEAGGGARVPGTRTSLRVKNAVEYLGDAMRRDGEDVLVGRSALGGVAHQGGF